ncbi:ESX secretion-associated protein EspG [Nocardia sp. NPDC024068]|uniref:ESX secretion-associated protein EspG n=1 Tax=Nocardia sp. NPDC024068 TaxID=3157197 RepID=UPI0033FDD8BA
MATDPVSIDLNVDAALLLRSMVGIDTYPPVLSIRPNIFRIQDRDRVWAIVREQLAEAGMISGDEVHPVVAGWIRRLARPDTELMVQVIDRDQGTQTPTILRASLVRAGNEHVLAVRHDDHIVIQAVFHEGRDLNTLTAVVKSALGDYPALDFDPLVVPAAALEDIPAGPDERRAELRELGALPRTASVLTRAMEEVVRRAEVIMVQHRDGGGVPDMNACMNVIDTLAGRLVATPSRAADGQLWSTFRPGDDPALHSGINALAELLPGRSWFDTARTG